MGATDDVAAAGSPTGDAGRLALREARRHLGVREDPPGSNRTPFGVWFGADGVPWCAIFVSYCFSVGAGATLCAGWAGAGVAPCGVAYVPTLEAWLRATGRWIVWPPRPGDIVVYDWDGGAPDHCGLVERVLADGGLATIEGNAGPAGGGVVRLQRAERAVKGFGRI